MVLSITSVVTVIVFIVDVPVLSFVTMMLCISSMMFVYVVVFVWIFVTVFLWLFGKFSKMCPFSPHLLQFTSLLLKMTIRVNLIFAYLTDANMTTVTRKEGYVSWGVYNLFLTLEYYWIHECIRDWTREWDPALNRITVWSNCHQGVIAMLSGGAIGQFF